MPGAMMDLPLAIAAILEHAARWNPNVEIVSRDDDGSLHRGTYRELGTRAAALARTLLALGVGRGDRVATLAWNGRRHVEAYFAIPGIGAICHTINPRLATSQIAAILRHAGDRVLLVEPDLLPLVEAIAGDVPELERTIVLAAPDAMPATTHAVDCYETLLARHAGAVAWPAFDETTPAGLCYTSGTTGAPRGALYTHRSTVLHALSCALAHRADRDALDVIMPIVPQFHVNAWGFPYVAAMLGSKLVLPGRRLDPESLLELIDGEGVTLAAAVPTIWWRLLESLRANGRRATSLLALAVGGSAMPAALVAAYADEYGVETLQGWGMTETSPVVMAGRPRPEHRAGPEAVAHRVRAGRPLFGVDLRIVDATGAILAHDGMARGELHVRGHWVASAYFRDPEATARAFTADGWFRTGDVAAIDPDGYLQIVDRVKDLIKSGGEWIGSVELEQAILTHPGIADAAAIAVPDPLWGERPLVVATAAPGVATPDLAALRAHLAPLVPPFWLPDGIVVLAELPRTSTGKIAKRALRARYPVMPAARARA